MSSDFKYMAFISYSHADQKTVKWLHRALEAYSIPKRLVGVKTAQGIVPKKFRPFFRDREDLSATTDLTKSVKKALAKSQFLIVVCSPTAAKSNWVNQEILEFKKLRSKENILCLITGGEPGASANPKEERLECFPSALRAGKGQFEPIAADVRPEGDGRRLAKLKLVAGMLGVGLDGLVQRDTQRRQRQLAAVAISSLAGVVILSGLLFTTIQAKKESEERREQAESQVKFMIEELKEPLGSVGKLELMDSVGREVLEFYASLDPAELDEEALAARAETLLMMGEIEDLRGDLDQAHQYFAAANRTTGELLVRNPENTDRIFEHSQSFFWVGYLDWRRGNLDAAEVSLRQYSGFSRQLFAINPSNADWQGEVGYSHNNLGTLYYNRGKFSDAAGEFEKAQGIFEQLAAGQDDRVFWQLQLAQALAWASDTHANMGALDKGMDDRLAELKIYMGIQKTEPGNRDAREALVVTYRALGKFSLDQGKIGSARDYIEQAITLGENLLSSDPENTLWAERLVANYLDYGKILILENTLPEAQEATDRAAKMTADLLALDSTVIRWRINLYYRSLLLQANFALSSGDYPGGLAVAEGAVAELTDLRGENLANRNILQLLSYGYFLLGEFHDSLGRQTEATAMWEETVRLVTPHINEMALGTRDILARAYLRLGRRDEADAIADEFQRIGYRHPEFTRYWQKWANP